jgi:hypothetical protein
MTKRLSLSIIILLVLIVPTFLYFFRTDFFTFHDETQIANMYAYRDTIASGQFPPRWTTLMSYGYGSPLPQFNYQLPYYLDYILSLFNVSLIHGFKILMVGSLVAGAIGMLLFARLWTSPYMAILVSVLFTYAPYRSTNVFVRGSLGESFALAIAPFILLGLSLIIKKRPHLGLLITSLATSALILSHQPSTLIILPAIYSCFLIYALVYDRPKLSTILFSIFMSLGLSAYYWLPVILEKSYLTLTSPFNFYDHFPFIKQFFSSPWGYGGSEWGPDDKMSFALGIPLWTAFFTSSLLFVRQFFVKKDTRNWLLATSIFAVIMLGFFLMNIRSSFFWQVFPYTSLIQFPWRLLIIPTILIPVSLVFYTIKSNKLTLTLVGLFSLLTIYLNYGYFAPGDIFPRTDDYFLRRFLPQTVLYDGETISPEYLKHSEDYLPQPKYSARPTTLSDLVESELSTSIIYYQDTNPYRLKLDIEAPNSDRITFNQHYYPGWLIRLNGEVVTPRLDEYGAQSFLVSKGKHVVDIRFVDTPARFVGNLITLVSLSILFLFIYLRHARRAH